MITVALSDFTQGVLAPLAVIGGCLVVGALAWPAMAAFPEIVWWTVKRLALAPDYRRDNSAAYVGGARKAWRLRIPYGVRIIVALGGTREEHEAYAELIRTGRQQVKQPGAGTGPSPSAVDRG